MFSSASSVGRLDSGGGVLDARGRRFGFHRSELGEWILDTHSITTCRTTLILMGVSVPVPTRFSEEDLAAIDELVDQGVGATRSEVVRCAVRRLADEMRRAKIGEAIAASYRDLPQEGDDGWALASAVAMVESEPWWEPS